MVLVLGALIAAFHGRSIRNGLFLDDHAHFDQLRECGWSLGELTRACRLELFGGALEAWWMPEVTLRFFRPVAFGLMKLTYTLTGWQAGPMHVASLLWHWVVCLLLVALLRRLGAGWVLATACAALFAIHPGQMGTVQWIATQSELMVTTFTLAALLCYLRFRGVDIGATAAPHGRVGSALAALAFFVLALGCRENAIMLPVVLAAVEPWLPRRRGRWMLHASLWIAVGAYLLVRSAYLSGAALPPPPYVVPPGDPAFLRFVFDKFCYYVIAEFLLFPCVPLGGLDYLRAQPFLFYGSAAGVLLLLGGVCWVQRRRLAAPLGLAALVGFMLPVLPAFESPHHLYLPGIGWTVLTWLLLQTLAGEAAQRSGTLARVRLGLCAATVVALAIVFGAGTFVLGLVVDTGHRVEARIVDELLASPRPIRDGDTLYFVNLPPIAHYVRQALEQRTDLRNLRVVALTWSPRLLGLATPAELTWEDPRTLVVRIAGDRYFAGPLGLLARQASGRDETIEPREKRRYRDLEIELVNRDDQGVSGLRFRLPAPADGPGVHVIWGSRTRWAAQVQP